MRNYLTYSRYFWQMICIIWVSNRLWFPVHNCHLSSSIQWVLFCAQPQGDWVGFVNRVLQSMETVNERNGSILCDFRLNMFANWGGSEDTKVLSLCSAVLIGLDGSYQHIVSKWEPFYFSSIVLVAIYDIINSNNQHI